MSSRIDGVDPNSTRELDSQGGKSDEKRRPLLLDSVDSGDDPDAPSSGRQLERAVDVAPSPKKSRSNSTIPTSKQLNPSSGYAGIRSRLRSVLHHPYGLPLAWFLNKDSEAGRKATARDGVSATNGTAAEDHQRGWGDGSDEGEGGCSVAREQIGEAAFGVATGPPPRTSENDNRAISSPARTKGDDSPSQQEKDTTMASATKTTATFPKTGGGEDQDRKAPPGGLCLSGDPGAESSPAKVGSPHGVEGVGGDRGLAEKDSREEVSVASAAAADATQDCHLEIEAPIGKTTGSSIGSSEGTTLLLLNKHFGPQVSALKAANHDQDLEGADTVLGSSFSAGLVPAEKDITTNLVFHMKAIVTKFGLKAQHEPHFQNSRVEAPSYGKPDIVLVRRECSSSSAHTVMLLEVGLNNVHWWSKVHQGVMYLEDLLTCDQKKDGIQFSGPALFAVLTIEPTETKEFKAGRLGVFLVTPRTSPDEDGKTDFRVCLLSRFETSQESIIASTPAERLTELSRVFGQLLRASCKVPALDAAPIDAADMDFEYLGPNCSRIGDEVSYIRVCPHRRLRACRITGTYVLSRPSLSHFPYFFGCVAMGRSYDPLTADSTSRSAVPMCTYILAW
jgi:hypothetical protein